MSEESLVISRTFEAPRAMVWKAWTEPERVKQWWGPKDFTCPVAELDFRVDGKYLFCMRTGDSMPPEFVGKDFWSTGTYREIETEQKLVMTDSFADADGNIVPGTYYGMPDEFPRELLVVLTFEDVGEGPPSHKVTEGHRRTKLTVRHEGMPGGESREQTEAGWNETLDKLAASLHD